MNNHLYTFSSQSKKSIEYDFYPPTTKLDMQSDNDVVSFIFLSDDQHCTACSGIGKSRLNPKVNSYFLNQKYFHVRNNRNDRNSLDDFPNSQFSL